MKSLFLVLISLSFGSFAGYHVAPRYKTLQPKLIGFVGTIEEGLKLQQVLKIDRDAFCKE